jgi:hypothetical protein
VTAQPKRRAQLFILSPKVLSRHYGLLYQAQDGGRARQKQLRDAHQHHQNVARFYSQSWIWNGKVAITIRRLHGKLWEIGVWKYPAGDATIQTIASDSGKNSRLYGLTVNIASH